MTDDSNLASQRKGKAWLGAVPGLAIILIGFVLAMAPWVVAPMIFGSGPINNANGWTVVIVAWTGMATIFIGVAVAIIGLIIKAFVDNSKNRKQ